MTSICYHSKNSNCSKHQKENAKKHGKQNLVLKIQLEAKGKIITRTCLHASMLLRRIRGQGADISQEPQKKGKSINGHFTVRRTN